MEIEIFNYEEAKHGFEERLNSMKNAPPFENVSKVMLARAGFRMVDSYCSRVECQFCQIELEEPTSNDEVIANHVATSPDCILMQSEFNYTPRSSQFYHFECRIDSFSQSCRFMSHLPRTNEKRVLTNVQLFVKSGFYFAEQVTVFDQMKCFFCDASFDCEILHRQNMTQREVHTLHGRKNGQCTFLIQEVGAVEVHKIKSRRSYSPPSKSKLERVRSEVMPVYQLTDVDSDDSDDDSTRKELSILREMVQCRHCCSDRATILLSPCHHLALCDSCNFISDSCPVCNVYITDKIKVLT